MAGILGGRLAVALLTRMGIAGSRPAGRGLALLGLASLVLASLSLGGAVKPAMAQEGMGNLIPNYVGAGAGFAPSYLGSNRSTFGAAPAARLQFDGQRSISLIGPRIEANLLNSQYFQVGPILNFRFGRSGADDRAVRNLGSLNSVLEGGITIGGTYIGTGAIPFRARAGVAVVSDMTGAYGGVSALPFVSLWVPLSPTLFIGAGATARFSPASQNRYYFGISQAQSQRSGLAGYDPGGSGFAQFSAWPAVVWRFRENWAVGASMLYSRLSDEAAASPIVRRGSRDQLVGGLGIAYLW